MHHISTHRDPPGRHRGRWPILGVLLALAATLAACSEDGDPAGDATDEFDLVTNRLEITVVDGGLDPSEASPPAGPLSVGGEQRFEHRLRV